MTYYARYDASAPVPQPVLGWRDTTFHDKYPPLAAGHALLELTPAQWQAHMSDLRSGWTIQNGELIPPAPSLPLVAAPKPSVIDARFTDLETRILALENKKTG